MRNIMLDELYDMVKEGVSSARAKYVDTGKVPEDVFDMFVRGDPSRKKKYVEWMAREYANDPTRPEHTVDDIRLFDQAVMRKRITGEGVDIYQYANREELEQALSVMEPGERLKSKSSGKGLKSQMIVHRDDDEFLIVQPLTYEASHAIAVAVDAVCTKGERKGKISWCVSYEGERGVLHWKDFYYQNNMFYIIVQKETRIKFNVQVEPNGKSTAWDENDKPHDLDYMREKFGIDKSVF